ncbi:hypothetical protein AGMMS49957_11720 [Synergistales bacterium]|nr:hypothetical protein AGMMS49957_11720 [Synergistales bacterium]
MDTIHVVLAVCDPKGTYSRHAGVVMTSIFEHTKSQVCVHILHDETLTDGNRARFEETADTYGQSVEFHDVSLFMEQMSEYALQHARKGHSIGALFRLSSPDILKIDKAIYLDVDIIVNMNIQELWDIPMEGRSLAGARDMPIGRFSAAAFRRKLMGCDWKDYVNSGVLIMNLSQIREKYNLLQQSAQWYKYCRSYSHLVDQNFLNSCFRGDIKIIDARFNNGNARDNNSANSILHSMGIAKPWNGLTGSVIDRLYWKTWTKTPWGRLEPDKAIDMVINVVENSPYTHRHTSQCYKKIFYRLLKDAVCNDVVMIVWLCAKYLICKISNANVLQRRV